MCVDCGIIYSRTRDLQYFERRLQIVCGLYQMPTAQHRKFPFKFCYGNIVLGFHVPLTLIKNFLGFCRCATFTINYLAICYLTVNLQRVKLLNIGKVIDT